MMRRLVVVLLLVLAFWTVGAGPALAQGGASLSDGWAGPGYYLNWIKLAACWLIFLFWVATTDWVSRDAIEKKMDYLRWNPAVFGIFLAALRGVVVHSRCSGPAWRSWWLPTSAP